MTQKSKSLKLSKQITKMLSEQAQEVANILSKSIQNSQSEQFEINDEDSIFVLNFIRNLTGCLYSEVKSDSRSEL